MTYKRLSQTERQRVFQQYSQGQTVKDLAAEFGVSENTIRRIVKQMETQLETASPPLPLLDLEMAVAEAAPVADSIEEEELGEEVIALGEDDYDDDSDEEDIDEEELGTEPVLPDEPEIEAVDTLEVMPLAAATLPRPCYVVVDRRSELLTRPLGTFRGLGPLSPEEAQQSTLPIFDNRPVALRYSQQNQRLFKASDVQWRKTVIKVPDGEMLRKVTGYLQSKGITRLLYHGRVYALDLE